MSPRGAAPRVLELETPHGLARAHVHAPQAPRGLLVLGHGAGGGVGAPDLLRAATAAGEEGVAVALVEQPYRVAGRRSPAPAHQLDAAFTAVVDAIREGELPLVVGGRSSGARVACRTSQATGALGVLCLAFPLLAPARRDGERPSRLGELDAVTAPVLVVQGENDRFGIPPGRQDRRVVIVGGDHSLRKDGATISAVVRTWLRERIDG